MKIFDGLNRRFEAWVVSRHHPEPSPQRIRRGRCYILPTRPGYLFALMLLAMLLGAMNYSNALAFALTFLLAGMGLVTMHHTNANLLGLSVGVPPIPPVFAGEPVHVPIQFGNDSKSSRYSILAAPRRQGLRHDRATDCAGGDRAMTGFDLPPQERGCHALPRFAVATEFPLGLFQAWSWQTLDCDYLVYPRPAGRRPLPSAPGRQGQRSGWQDGRDEFSHLRDYRPGDSLRSIHWKRYPATGRLSVKTFAEPMDESLWLSWHSLADLNDPEQRLSQLCRWVLDCEAGRNPYGLRLPGKEIPPGRGLTHRNACLEALARFSTSA